MRPNVIFYKFQLFRCFSIKWTQVKAEVRFHYYYFILLSLFKSNMSVANRLAHKFSLRVSIDL